MAIWICPECGKEWDDSRYTQKGKGVPWGATMRNPICEECAKGEG